MWSSVVQNNVVYPYFVELTLGLPAGSAEVRRAAGRPHVRDPHGEARRAAGEPRRRSRRVARARGRATAAPPNETVVYAWKEHRDTAAPKATRVKQLEIENLHLKQLIGNLSLEKKLLLERLAALEPTARRNEGDAMTES